MVAVRRFFIHRGHAGGGSTVDPFEGYMRLSSLLPTLAAGDQLTLGAASKLLIDTEVEDSDRIGFFVAAPGSKVRFDPSQNTRLLCDSFLNFGETKAMALDESGAYPMRGLIDVCGPIPTVSGNPGGGPLVRGRSHIGNTSTGNNSTTNDAINVPGVGSVFGGSRAILNFAGGTLQIKGTPGESMCRLNAAYSSGANLVLNRNITAKAGSTVLIGPTYLFKSSQRTEIRTLAVDANNTNIITINAPLGYARTGQCQWYTDTGISFTQGPFTMGGSGRRTHVDQDPTIDQRAIVCIIDRSFGLRGYDVAGHSTSGADDDFWLHLMAMGLTSKTSLENVGFYRYGQGRLLGRYGAHWHVPSYDIPTGAAKTDGAGGTNIYATGNALLKGCTFTKGFNRTVVPHGACGVVVDDCILHDSVGHSLFLEDGSEMYNHFTNLTIMAPRFPASGQGIKRHDESDLGSVTGLWISNLNNQFKNIWITDAPLGFWNAVSQGLVGVQPDQQHGCLGFSSNVPVCPQFERQIEWSGINCLSCDGGGRTDTPPFDNEGNLSSGGPHCTTTGIWNDYDHIVRPRFEYMRIFQCNGPYGNRINEPDYHLSVRADNPGPQFSGVAFYGFLTAPIMVARSLTPDPSYDVRSDQVQAMASYHGGLAMTDAVLDGFKDLPANGANARRNPFLYSLLMKPSVIEGWDLYTDPVQMWSYYNSGWKLYDSVAFYQTPGPAIVNDNSTWDADYGFHCGEDDATHGLDGSHRRWAIGISYDHWGLMSSTSSVAGVPHGHIVFNVPFYTTGDGTLTDMPGQSTSKVSKKQWFGFAPAEDDTWNVGPYGGFEPACSFARYDTSGAPITGARLDFRASFNPSQSWGDVDTGEHPPQRSKQGDVFWGGRHGACPAGGIMLFKHTDLAVPNRQRLTGVIYCTDPIWNPYANASDSFVMGVQWNRDTPPHPSTSGGSATSWTQVMSWAALMSAGKFSYFHDLTTDICWCRIGRPDGTLYGGGGTIGGSIGNPPSSFFNFRVDP